MTQLPEIENMASIFNKRLNYQFPTETSNYGYYSPKNDSITYYSKGKKIRIENISKTRKTCKTIKTGKIVNSIAVYRALN